MTNALRLDLDGGPLVQVRVPVGTGDRSALPKSTDRPISREGSSPGPAAEGEAPPSPPASGASVRIALEGVSARVESRAGTTVALGEVEVWRTSPPPPELLGRVPWQVTLDLVDTDARPRARWAAGPAVGLVSGEWAYGAAVEAPPLRFGRFEARPVVLGLAGGGEWMIAGAITVAW